MEAMKELFERMSPGRQGHDPDNGEEYEALARRAYAGLRRSSLTQRQTST